MLDDSEEHGPAISPESYNNNNSNTNSNSNNNNNNNNMTDDGEKHGQAILSESTYNIKYSVIIDMPDDGQEHDQVLWSQSYTIEGRVIINMPDDDDESQAISSEPNSLASATTAVTPQDSLKPDECEHSRLVASRQLSSTGHALAIEDGNKVNRKNIYDEPVDFVYGNYRNCSSLCVIVSGGNMQKTTENDPFERNCHNTSVLTYKHFTKLGVENIVMISPIENYSTGDIVIPQFQKLTSKDVIDLFDIIKRKHSEKAYSVFFLIIIGHAPGNILRMHNVDEDCYISESKFYISKDCFIAVPEIKSLTDNLASCELLGIIKDMCKGGRFNLLPDYKLRPKNAVHFQISSSARNGKSYSRTPVYNSTLFTSCMLSGCDKGRPCPIVPNPNGITNMCNVCSEYQKYLTTGGIISYNILFGSYVKPHLLMTPVIENSDLPVLEFRSDQQEQELIRGIETPNIPFPEVSKTAQSVLPDNYQLSPLVPNNQLPYTGHQPAFIDGNYCPLLSFNISTCHACIKYRTNITNAEISPTDAQKWLVEQHLKMMKDIKP